MYIEYRIRWVLNLGIWQPNLPTTFENPHLLWGRQLSCLIGVSTIITFKSMSYDTSVTILLHKTKGLPNPCPVNWGGFTPGAAGPVVQQEPAVTNSPHYSSLQMLGINRARIQIQPLGHKFNHCCGFALASAGTAVVEFVTKLSNLCSPTVIHFWDATGRIQCTSKSL